MTKRYFVVTNEDIAAYRDINARQLRGRALRKAIAEFGEKKFDAIMVAEIRRAEGLLPPKGDLT